MGDNSTNKEVYGFAAYGIIHKIQGEPRKFTRTQEMAHAQCGEVIWIDDIKEKYYADYIPPSDKKWSHCTCTYQKICPMTTQSTLRGAYRRLINGET